MRSGTLKKSLPEVEALHELSPDGRMLLLTRLVRMFAFGLLSIVLALYLAEIGFNERQIGLLLTGTFVGDALLSLWITSIADRVGRRLMLMAGTALMIAAGAVFTLSDNYLLLTLAAIFGTLSPHGAEVGPFLSIEQAALPHTTADRHRTAVFGWYNLIALSAKAAGALGGGVLAGMLQNSGTTALTSYRIIFAAYTILGLALLWLNSRLSPEVEAKAKARIAARSAEPFLGLRRSRRIVLHLAALFALDSFAGGLILQSLIAYWLTLRFDVSPTGLGMIFFGINLLGGLSTLLAARVAGRFGLINTMVWTHIPSNILLVMAPFMPNITWATIVLLARATISQMDVPTRQSYTMAIVDPDERSAAAGVTTIARTAGSAAAPALTGMLFAAALLGAPFVLAGMLKIVYDLSLYASFRAIRPPEELRG